MTEKKKRIRGSGVNLTLPLVLRYSSLWIVVTVASMLVSSVAAYALLTTALTDEGRQELLGVLFLQTVLFLIAVAALAVFSTHRLAGPFIAMQRAFQDVKGGDLRRRLHFRRSDKHLRDLEKAFNEMMAALEERMGPGGVS